MGIQKVYDFKMNDGKPYNQANGLVIHNCGETPLGPWEACVLGSINLSNFITYDETDKIIDWERLKKVVKIAVRALDNIISASQFPLKEIQEAVLKTRKIGLGVMGFSDLLVKLKVSYNSEEALELADKIMEFIKENAYEASEEIGKEKGNLILDGTDLGRRNGTLLVQAPTGTVSLISNCSAGIEPIFALEYTKKCIDKELIIKNKLWEEYLKEKHTSAYPYKPHYFIDSKEVPIEQHVRMQAAFQKHICSATSKTINAPFETTIKEVDSAFKLAYRLGCKGLTFYRDKSREDQAQTAVELKKTTLEEIKKEGYIAYKGIPTKTKELPPEKVEQARAAISRLAKNYRKNSDPDIETPEWLPGWREKIKTGDGTLWVHVFTDPSTGFREVWTAVSKPGRTLAAAADSTGRLITLALKKGASWDEIVKQLQGHIGEKTAWNNGVQVLSIQDGTAQVLRRRCIEKNIPMVECPFEFSCHKDELEVVETIEDKSRIIYQSQEEIDNLHRFGERVAEEFMNTDLCPDCGSVLLHDEGCKGGRCETCGFSHCS